MFLRQVALRRGFPFEIKLPEEAPPAYAALTKERFDAETAKGKADIKAGNVHPADAVEAEMRRDYGV